jgi:tRNA-dihydrouridine synthase 3
MSEARDVGLDARLWLAPLTRGGHQAFRRLCVEMGAEVTVGEMAVVRRLQKNDPAEFGRLRNHPDEPFFGAQIADRNGDGLAEGARMAEARGAKFVDLNCGCPIDEITGRGLGASLLRKPARLGRLVEAMAKAVKVPITVKLRLGWKEGEENVHETARACEEGGAKAIAIHGRTREQRYTRAADWEAIGRVAAERGVTVVGNGDVLTPFEAEAREAASGVRAVMVGRGALIKPWIFRELKEGRPWLPTAEERIAVYARLVVLMREYFGSDERGERRIMTFLPWHFGFFHRYRPTPDTPEMRERSAAHPLLQSRIPVLPTEDPLERLLTDDRPETHEAIARLLLAEPALDALVVRARELGAALAPAVPHEEPALELTTEG